MNRILIRALAAAAAAGSLCMTASAEILTRVALLRGDAEVPANATTAGGWGMFVIDTDANTLSYRIAYSGLSSAETAAHIHGFSGPQANSPVLIGLPAGTPKVGVWNFTEAQQPFLLAGSCYVNIHTVNFPGGEIRGQIVSAVAELSGDQESPVNASPNTGFALFHMDYCTNQLEYFIRYSGVTGAETAAHIHGKALPTVNAGVLEPLPAANPKIGVWAYDPSLEQNIADGLMYVNIHSTAFPGGEIRGQIVTMVNPVDGLQEVGPVVTTAAGGALISLDRVNNTMGFGITHRGLINQTAAHIHGYSPAGVNSGVQFGLGVGTPKRGTWNFGAANLQNILDEFTYFNAHTAAFPGGEIRGQLRMSQVFYCPADFDKNGLVDLNDFFGFLNAFDTTATKADINCDGNVDLNDYFEFFNGFDASC